VAPLKFLSSKTKTISLTYLCFCGQAMDFCVLLTLTQTATFFFWWRTKGSFILSPSIHSYLFNTNYGTN